jgi:ComF family protein
MMRSSGATLLHDADCVVPVPLHPWRRVRRGFNQAADLARWLDQPIVHALWRRRSTLSQSGLSARERRSNVRAAFTLSPLMSRAALRRIEAHVIVLVDDVRTTGATLEACAAVLKQAGAREIRALTIAHALPPTATKKS